MENFNLEARYTSQLAGGGADRSRDQLCAELAVELGIDDLALVETLIELGVTPETAPAFEALPLVEVAWADGEVDEEERWRLLAAATAFGLEVGRPAHAQLELWITRPPAPELLDAWRAFASRGLTTRGAAPRARRVLEDAFAVAAASGGLLGFGAVSSNERAAIARIREALGRDGEITEI